jgi:hypothetical protein
MNYKNIALRTLQEFCDVNPKMSLGEVFYSILREKNSDTSTLSDVKNITDEKMYTIIEKAKQFEEE